MVTAERACFAAKPTVDGRKLSGLVDAVGSVGLGQADPVRGRLNLMG